MSASKRRRNGVRSHGALAAAIRRDEWERVALVLLISVAEVARTLPAGTIDDVLALLSPEEPRDE